MSDIFETAQAGVDVEHIDGRTVAPVHFDSVSVDGTRVRKDAGQRDRVAFADRADNRTGAILDDQVAVVDRRRHVAYYDRHWQRRTQSAFVISHR